MTDEQFAGFMRAVATAHQIPLRFMMPTIMARAALTFGMFIVWAWVDEATFDGREFRYTVQLDNAIKFTTIEVVVNV